MSAVDAAIDYVQQNGGCSEYAKAARRVVIAYHNARAMQETYLTSISALTNESNQLRDRLRETVAKIAEIKAQPSPLQSVTAERVREFVEMFDEAAHFHGWASDGGSRIDASTANKQYKAAKATLNAAIEQMAVDAERYRWLVNARTKAETDVPEVGGSCKPQDKVIAELATYYCHGEYANQIIDAARAAPPGA